MKSQRSVLLGIALASLLAPELVARGNDDLPEAKAEGWLSWRGADQAGTSTETGLVDTVTVDGENHLWSYTVRGRGTPVIANGRVFAMGYSGEDADLQEHLMCLDEQTGELIWERRYNDFLTDVIYDRYSIGAPTIDPETGNVYCLTSAGLLCAYTSDGGELWQRSTMSEFGRLSFPNGRTGSPVIDDDLVIIHIISAHWGRDQGPAEDRFYAFDKVTGESVWNSSPGHTPKDSPYSYPVLDWVNGKRVLYSGTGCGNVVCINARNGEPIWRFKLATGGVNASVVLHEDKVIAIHGRENMDSSVIGRIIALKAGAEAPAGHEGEFVIDKEHELWRNDLVSFTSSPVLVGDRIYQTVQTGELVCVNVNTGEILWRQKLASTQIHASPIWGDGKLYVPMNDGSFHIVRPTDDGPQILKTVQLEGNCLGAPAICNGRIYVHTTEKLYCFGKPLPAVASAVQPRPMSAAKTLQIVPHDVLVRQGERVSFRVRALDEKGLVVSRNVQGYTWDTKGFDISFDNNGDMLVAHDAQPRVGVVKARIGDVEGNIRLRIVGALPYTEDFEGIALTIPDKEREGEKISRPPSHWIGAGPKFDVRRLEDGNKVLAKTLGNPLFQRATALIGQPEMSNYTMQVDIMTDGNRRIKSTAGVVNQRYLIQLKGNHQQIEISSNMERIKETVPFRWKAKTWYTLKTRVDIGENGKGVVRAKCWKRDEPEPEGWNIEVPHNQAHQQGSPGIFGFSPQSRFRVYVDNIVITPNV